MHTDIAQKLTGTVKFYKEDRGYGFISTTDRDIFFHISQWVHETEPCKGDRVEFIEDVGRDGRPCARQIIVR
jgi:cold shock CspA family protein